MKSGSRLERVLSAGHFAVTCELGPPKGASAEAVFKKAEHLAGQVDAVNITDNQTAVVRMSSLGAAALCLQKGLEPIMQITCRDRNRIAMQSDVLGAHALGIRNLLCLSGDHPRKGSQPYARTVYDIDSIQEVAMVKRMRDENRLLDLEEELAGGIGMFIGVAENPFAEPRDFRPYRLKKKVDAGADFIQTQSIYDIGIFREWMKTVCDLGLHERCHILPGIIPLKSINMARYMLDNVPGVFIPDAILNRMEKAPKGQAGEVGIQICLELIEQVRAVEGVHGIHLMAIEWEHRVPGILDRAGLLPRPVLD